MKPYKKTKKIADALPSKRIEQHLESAEKRPFLRQQPKNGTFFDVKRTPQGHQLQQEWYAKLAAQGFEDIEPSYLDCDLPLEKDRLSKNLAHLKKEEWFNHIESNQSYFAAIREFAAGEIELAARGQLHKAVTKRFERIVLAEIGQGTKSVEIIEKYPDLNLTPSKITRCEQRFSSQIKKIVIQNSKEKSNEV